MRASDESEKWSRMPPTSRCTCNTDDLVLLDQQSAGRVVDLALAREGAVPDFSARGDHARPSMEKAA